MYCTKCGSKLPNESKFCTTCGEKVSVTPINSRQNDQSIVASHDMTRETNQGIPTGHVPRKQSCESPQNQFIRIQKEQLEMQKRQLDLQQIQLQSMARCPKCGSTSLSGNKKGFGIGKAVIGAAVAGPIGLVAGNLGSKKVKVTCMNCGKQYKA